MEEVRAWALASPENVDPDFAAMKHAETSERRGWQVRGQLIDWRARFKRFWEEDGQSWRKKNKKNGAATFERKPGDAEFWFTDSLADVRAVLGGAVSSNSKKMAARLREVIAWREAHGN